ncbi:MAG TPA: SRPBCC family protein [Candidatus Acidoferrales bacterium]|jgi:ligand-binding SRPBCC domain-containing protein|nr:SRPBCC family protein [Candidatus Acidoferrales bacterium]
MKIFALDSAIWIPRPIDEVFAFFADAHNLGAITPPWMHFRTVTPGPIVMAVGTRFEHRLRVKGIPIRWESEITVWDPPRRFVDEQRRGPYRRWVHEHRFAAHDGGTDVADHVDYVVPGGTIVNGLIVAPDLRKVFEYRRQTLLARFPRPQI